MTKIDMRQLRNIVRGIISETHWASAPLPEKKTKKGQISHDQPHHWTHEAVYDFARPLGVHSHYGQQGASNFGPYTGVVDVLPEEIVGAHSGGPDDINKSTRSFIQGVMRESLVPEQSAWVVEESKKPETIWEAAQHWYDHQGLGLGRVGSAGIAEKKEKLAKKAKVSK
ncbi:MAG TPA: hypothetical protein VFT74_21445 [Isosphaeraceae bacterium]|nr:hypothetical protein [Isosphaeraceae bacterium]